jgi:thioredoxin-related protein
MNTRITSILVVTALVAFGLVAFLSSPGASGQGAAATAQIKWHSFDEGVALARQENKKILIDVYTDWCVWCKKMDKDVYTDKGVGKSISSDFVAVKLNAESTKGLTYNGEHTDEASFARAMGVTGYPTIVFLAPGSQPITKIDGYVEPKEFTSVLRFIGKDYYKTKSFDEFKSFEGSLGGK